MKSTKIFAIALAALMTTACSDDDDLTYNTEAGVTVEMAETSISVKENQGLFTVPMVINGTPNGYLTVTVKCTETGTDPAIANRNYYLTTDRINIADDAKTADVEFRAVDFRGLNPDRTFNVTIESVQGGAVGANNTTTVTIVDKGSSPLYNELPGNYIFHGMSMDTNEGSATEGQFVVENMDDVSMTLGTPDGNGGGTVIVSGVLGMFQMELTYDYDNEEKYGELLFNYGAIAATNTGFDKVAWVNQQGSETAAPVRGKWNDTFTAVTFGDDSSYFGLGVFDPTYIAPINAIGGPILLIRPKTAQ